MTLLINEIYPAIQGEGKSLGKNCLFIRTFGCNLKCDFAKGSCDSAFTWNPNFIKKQDKQEISFELFEEIIKKYPKNLNHWIITGGEPMLQEKKISIFINKFINKNHIKPLIEWETNGSIIPSKKTNQLSHQYNVSIKLSNSMGKIKFNTKEKRINKKAINFFVNNPKSNFKFVIGSEKDLKEMEEIATFFKISPNRIWLMPEGTTKEQANKKKLYTFALNNGYNYTPRLHILLFGNKRKT